MIARGNAAVHRHCRIPNDFHARPPYNASEQPVRSGVFPGQWRRRHGARRDLQCHAPQRGPDGSNQPRTAEVTTALSRLTDRQREILALVAEGKTNAQIAYTLTIITGTAKKHLEHISKRLQVGSRTAAAAIHLRACRDSDGRSESR